jgi:hypothetical protein
MMFGGSGGVGSRESGDVDGEMGDVRVCEDVIWRFIYPLSSRPHSHPCDDAFLSPIALWSGTGTRCPGSK